MGRRLFFCAWQSLYDKIIYSFDPRVTCSNFCAIIFSLSVSLALLLILSFVRSVYSFLLHKNTLPRPSFVPHKLKFKSICIRRGWPAFAMMLMLLYYYFLPFLSTFAQQPERLSLFWMVLFCSFFAFFHLDAVFLSQSVQLFDAWLLIAFPVGFAGVVQCAWDWLQKYIELIPTSWWNWMAIVNWI